MFSATPTVPGFTDPEGKIQGTCTFDCKTVPHITLKSIAQNQALDPIFEKWEPILAEKLAYSTRPLQDRHERHAGEPSSQAPGENQKEGKRPSPMPMNGDGDCRKRNGRNGKCPSIPTPTGRRRCRTALDRISQAWRQKMDEVNACIAARADQEELVDQPFMDNKKVRVSGPFTVEGVIPAEESIDLEPEESPIGGAPEELETFGDEAMQCSRSAKCRGLSRPHDQALARRRRPVSR